MMADEGEDAPVAAVAVGFGLPEELAAVLPADPFEQLDVARKITSIALASRVGRLEAEAAALRAQLAQRDDTAEDLRERVEQLESALALATDRLTRAEGEKVGRVAVADRRLTSGPVGGRELISFTDNWLKATGSSLGPRLPANWAFLSSLFDQITNLMYLCF
jgi:hypothetical protein